MKYNALGWRPPQDRTHETLYPMAKYGAPSDPTPVIIGIPWYDNFDRPQYTDGAHWIGRGDLGKVRGGHCVCLRPPAITDPTGAWSHYNQGTEGACVGFGTSRAATLYNRRLYQGLPLYKAAQQRDPWPGDAYSGTSVNAGLQTLRLQGAWRVKNIRPTIKDGILSYGWASTVTQITQALHTTDPYVIVLNSWGTAYPNEVRLPLDTLARLLEEEAEAGVPLDRIGNAIAKGGQS